MVSGPERLRGGKRGPGLPAARARPKCVSGPPESHGDAVVTAFPSPFLRSGVNGWAKNASPARSAPGCRWFNSGREHGTTMIAFMLGQAQWEEFLLDSY